MLSVEWDWWCYFWANIQRMVNVEIKQFKPDLEARVHSILQILTKLVISPGNE